MSSSYSANQYDGAFKSCRLQNWGDTRRFKERPTAQQGQTTFIADDRGHLLPGLMKRGSAWADFKGTWDLPARIPTRTVNPTGRSVAGLNRLKSWGIDPQPTGAAESCSGSMNTERPQEAGEQLDTLQQGNADPQTSAAEVRPASHPTPTPNTRGSRNQDPDAAPSPGPASGRDGAPSPDLKPSEERSSRIAVKPRSDVAKKAIPAGSSRQRRRDAQQDQ